MSEYYAPPGHDATPKPLAVYRDRLRWDDPTEARKDFYGVFWLRWVTTRKRLDLYKRHIHKVVDIALREKRDE